MSSASRRFGPSRRDFVRAGAAALAASSVAPFAAATNRPRKREATLHVGVVGCGGRGTGAAYNALEASEDVKIVALADLFPDRLQSSRRYLADGFKDRATVADGKCHTGFDAYRAVVEDPEVDLVILATPPHFRPAQFEAAVKNGKHVFMEKPVAVDPAGIRTVIAAGDEASKRKLSVVAGTQRRHERCYLEAMSRLRDGAIGEPVAARCYWNMGGLWVKEPRDDWSDLEWQIRNWLYFTWLSGDHIVEQHVHNLDVVNWAFDAHPIRALGLGGRQVRTDPKYGHIYDHHAVEYEYPDGQFCLSMCRQIDGCANRVEEIVHGTRGRLNTTSGSASIAGPSPWQFEGENPNPYVVEHQDLQRSIRRDEGLNEARRIAESTLTAIMGRLATYTGQEVTWERALNSELTLTPPAGEYEFGPCAVPPVPMPGKTPLV